VSKSPEKRLTAQQLSQKFLIGSHLSVSYSKVLNNLVKTSMPLIRKIRKEEPEVVGVAAAARDARVKVQRQTHFSHVMPVSLTKSLARKPTTHHFFVTVVPYQKLCPCGVVGV